MAGGAHPDHTRGQCAPAWAAGRHRGAWSWGQAGKGPTKDLGSSPTGISGAVLGPGPAPALLQCLQEQLTSLSGLWKHLGSVPVSAVGAQGTCRSAQRVAPGERSRRGAQESLQSGSWLFRVGDTILQLVNVTQPCVIGDKQQLLTAMSSVPSPASFAELLSHLPCWTMAVALRYPN